MTGGVVFPCLLQVIFQLLFNRPFKVGIPFVALSPYENNLFLHSIEDLENEGNRLNLSFKEDKYFVQVI